MRIPHWTKGLLTAAVLASPALAGDAPRRHDGVRLHLRERLTAERGEPARAGRFRLRLRAKVAADAAGPFELELGDLTVGVPLAKGRSAPGSTAGPDALRTRVRIRGGRLSAEISGRSASVPALGARVLRRVEQNFGGEPESAFHGLFAARFSVDGAEVPLAIGVVGRVVTGGRSRVEQRITFAATGLSTQSPSPVVSLVPSPARSAWDGRLRGAVLSAGGEPSLTSTTSEGRSRLVAPRDGPLAFDVGDGTSVADGVSSLAVGGVDVFQTRFDTAVQAAPGPRTVTLAAEDGEGRRGRSERAFEMPAAAPPVLADVNCQILEVRGGGALWAWGLNLEGEVGDGTKRDPLSPVRIAGPERVISVAAGDEFSLAVDGDGQAWIWGWWETTKSDHSGFVSFSVADTLPMRFPGLDGIVAVTAGMWDCPVAMALDTDGAVWALGSDCDDLLAHPFRKNRVRGLPRIDSISQSSDTSLALASDGSVWQITGMDSAQVPGVSGIRFVSAGEWGECRAIDADGAVLAWNAENPSVVTTLELPRPAVSVSAGDGYGGAILDDGSLWTWSGIEAGRPEPARVAELDGVTLFRAGHCGTAIAVDADGATWTWETWAAPNGAEAPVLAPRSFQPGHAPPHFLTLAKR